VTGSSTQCRTRTKPRSRDATNAAARAESERSGDRADGGAPDDGGRCRRDGAQLADERRDGEDHEGEDSGDDALAEEGDQPDEPACRDGEEEEGVAAAGGFSGCRQEAVVVAVVVRVRVTGPWVHW
jgi:hypothetical protein